ncbi:pilus assembly protein TadG-related protein [Aquipuribacter sp. MA13-6]|uniref:pilus assembly protein TadG-related protein n=1 Tax=unclassified Aquipuribacter TaxID=2635084 RepID=UPI003EE9C0B7
MSAVAPRSPLLWRDDRGATSVVFALVSLLLLAVAALAVDLTNLYAQRAVAQSRADAAAFAAAQALPDACGAVDAARRSLLDTGGTRSADEAAPVVRVYAADPRDADGDPATPPPPPATLPSTRPDCSTAGASVQVSTPPRRVPFVFAGVLDLFQEGSGIGRTSVSAVARVSLAEPDLLPLVLPQGCPGEAFLVTRAAPPPPPEPSPPPSSAPPSPPPSSAPPSPPSSTEASPPPSTEASPPPSTEASPPPSTDPPSPSPPPSTGPPASAGPPGEPAGDVTPRPQVQPRVLPRAAALQAPVPGCAAVRDGGLGVLDSPVQSGETGDARLLLNLRDGIDHAVVALGSADPDDPDARCEIGAPPGAVPDEPLATGTPSCVDVRPLVDVSVVRATLERRLSADPTFARCRTAPADATAWETVAACYLLEGRDRDDVLDAVGGPGAIPSLDESMLADPRFFVVPELVLEGADETGGFVPVLRLRGAFAVGLEPDGTLPAFVFPLEALPRLVLDTDAERPRTLVLTRPVGAPTPGGDP